MSQPEHNERWLNNPERRVGQAQLQRTLHAGLGTADRRYAERGEYLSKTGDARQPQAGTANNSSHRPHDMHR